MSRDRMRLHSQVPAEMRLNERTLLSRLLSSAVSALDQEDQVLRELLYGRSGYEHFAPGILSLFETSVVFAMFKLLVTSLPRGWVVDWETKHGVGHKKIDLLVSRLRPLQRCAIEVKWWTKSDYDIAADCDKLLNARQVHRRAALILRARRDGTGDRSLAWLIQRSMRSGRLRQFHVQMVGLRELPVLGRNRQQAIMEIALIEILGRPHAKLTTTRRTSHPLAK